MPTATPPSSKPPAKPVRSAKRTSSGKGSTGNASSGKRKRIDWEAVERDYRTGKFTLRELADKHGGSHQAIAKQAKKRKWTQDLGDQIRLATNAKLVANLVAKEVASGGQAVANVVLAAAEINTQIILGQRTRVGKAVGVAVRMLDELDATTAKAGQIQAMFESITEDMGPADLAAAQQQFREFMRLHNRVGSAHKLMDALSKAQSVENQAYRITDGDTPDDKRRRTLPIEFVDAVIIGD